MNNPQQNQTPPLPSSPAPAQGLSGLKIFAIVFAACVVSSVVALVAVYFYLFPGAFKPVNLSATEEQRLEEKLERLDPMRRAPVLHKSQRQPEQDNTLSPERYTESDANRDIIFTERELNALLAKNTDLATRLAIDLSQDLASAKLLIPLDEELPVLGGKNLKITAGLELSYRDQHPVVILRGISIWGVPVPNAWMGGIKHVDLVREFGDEQGFWKSFADGVDQIEITDGQLRIRLKE